MINKITLLVLIIASQGYGHENHEKSKPVQNHQPSTSGDYQPKAADHNKKIMHQINEMYKANIKPIFQKKCFDCHSSQGRSPWYKSLPIAKTIIDSDIAKAKEHLDFSNDFPFKSHADPSDDLKAIQASIENGKMPPFRYRIVNWGSTVTEEELMMIKNWVSQSTKLLKTDTSGN